MKRTIEALVLSFVIAMAGVAFSFSPAPNATAGKGFGISMVPIGTYHSGIFEEGGAEIVSHDPETQRVFVVNAQDVMVDVLDISDPAEPTKIGTIDASPYGASANSVAVSKGVVAVAIENEDKQAPGTVAFFDTDGDFLSSVEVGALPDMLTFTSNGKIVLVANEGEPADYCSEGLENDPEGSVSIIHLRRGAENVQQSDVVTATFTKFNNVQLDQSIRIFGPNATVAQDLEPEYIAIARGSNTAYVTLQENNAIGLLDIRKGEFTKLVGLGFKDHSLDENGIDASDDDGAINITSWPVKGAFMPDTIAAFNTKGGTYMATANEGDARDYDCFAEEERVKDIDLDASAFPDSSLQEDENLGRLTVTTVNGDTDDDGQYEELYSFGTRSFSIWNEKGKLVFDSGDDFEQITAEAFPDYFNADNAENGPDTFDNRSDNKGPEPEALALGKVHGSMYAFVGLERIGGVMVYDVSNPRSPEFVTYANNRDFAANIESPEAGDLGPESLVFVKAGDSPTGKPLLLVGNEISGTTTIYQITVEK